MSFTSSVSGVFRTTTYSSGVTVVDLVDGSINEVRFTEAPRQKSNNDYAEKALIYMVKVDTLGGRWRRVYGSLLGNSGVVYIKVEGRLVYCETALETALAKKVL